MARYGGSPRAQEARDRRIEVASQVLIFLLAAIPTAALLYWRFGSRGAWPSVAAVVVGLPLVLAAVVGLITWLRTGK